MDKEKLKALLQAHDWFYDWSDDMSVWTRGFTQRREIFEALGMVSANEAAPLIKQHCPSHLFYSFITQLQNYAKARIAK